MDLKPNSQDKLEEKYVGIKWENYLSDIADS